MKFVLGLLALLTFLLNNTAWAVCTKSFLTSPGATTHPTYYHCPTYAGRPVTGLNTGDLLFADDTGQVYPAINSTTWGKDAAFDRLTIDQVPDAGRQWFKVTTSEAASTDWNWNLNSAVNPQGSRRDQVMRFGWNVALNGTRENLTDGVMSEEWESHYEPDTNQYFERHFVYYSPSGSPYRLTSWQINKGTDFALLGVTTDKIGWFRRSDSAQWMIFEPYQITMNGGGVVLFSTNNVPITKQLNLAGNGYLSLPYINASNKTFIDAAGNGTIFGAGITTGSITVPTDYASALQVKASNGSTVVLNIDTANIRVGIAGCATPSYSLDSCSNTTSQARIGSFLFGSWVGVDGSYAFLQNSQLAIANGNHAFIQSSTGTLTQFGAVSGGTISFAIAASIKLQTNATETLSNVPIRQSGVAFGSLPASTNGSVLYCSDCDPLVSGVVATCTSAGTKTGAMAARINGAWKCFAG